MFAQPAALLFFVTKELADREPLERFLEGALMRSDDTGERRRQLGAHRDLAIAFVSKIEKLIDNLGAALFSIKIGRLEHGAVPFNKTVTPRHLAPARDDVIPRRTILRQKITKARKRLHDFKNRMWARARNNCAVE